MSVLLAAIKIKIAHLQNQVTVCSQVSQVKQSALFEEVAQIQCLYFKTSGIVH